MHGATIRFAYPDVCDFDIVTVLSALINHEHRESKVFIHHVSSHCDSQIFGTDINTVNCTVSVCPVMRCGRRSPQVPANMGTAAVATRSFRFVSVTAN